MPAPKKFFTRSTAQIVFGLVSAAATARICRQGMATFSKWLKPLDAKTYPGPAATAAFVNLLAYAGIVVLAVGVWMTAMEWFGRLVRPPKAQGGRDGAPAITGAPVTPVLEVLTKVTGSALVLIAGVALLALAATFAVDLVPPAA